MEQSARDQHAALLESMRRRLLDSKSLLPPFEGAWPEALCVTLKELLPHGIDQDLPLLRRVVQCFASVADDDVDALFQALRESIEKAPLTHEGDVHWVNELTCFAFIRTVNPEFLAAHVQAKPSPAPAGASAKPGAAHFSLKDASLASMAYTLFYTGLRFDGGSQGWVGAWTDIGDDYSDTVELADAILGTLRSTLLSRAQGVSARRHNPDDVDDGEWLGVLRTDLKARQRRGEACGICVRKPKDLPAPQWVAALATVAQRIHGAAVGYDRAHPGDLCSESSNITPQELSDQLRRVFTQVPALKKYPAVSVPRQRVPEPQSFEWDFFISHASEDKAGFVDQLVTAFEDLGWRVWYDKRQIMVGDSLLESIEEGLNRSRFAVVVISPASVQKPGWVAAEWDALLSRQTNLGEKRVLPVLLGLDHRELSRQKPFLARYLVADGSKGAASVAFELHRAVSRRAASN